MRRRFAVWILFVAVLVISGALAILSAPARIKRHAAEREAVLQALAHQRPYATEASIARELIRSTSLRLSARVLKAQLAALEEDGLFTAEGDSTASDRGRRYQLLVDPPSSQRPVQMPSRSSLTVYHDGSCPLCAVEIAQYRQAEGAGVITFVDASSVSRDEELTNGLSAGVALSRFHVRDEAGQLVSGAAAFSLLWQTLPRWHWLGRLIGSPVVLPLAERAYNLFLPLRPHLATFLVRTGILSSSKMAD